MTRKIPAHQENPVDDALIRLAELTAPAFKATGHTPNMLTGYSLVLGLAAVWALAAGWASWTFAALWMASYFFDCADGFYARAYGMVSQGGDLFDHVKDVVVYVLLVGVTAWKFVGAVPWATLAALGAAMAALMALGTLHLGCQEALFSGTVSQGNKGVLSGLKGMCGGGGTPGGKSGGTSGSNASRWIKWTRWFGMGTVNVATVMAVLYLQNSKL